MDSYNIYIAMILSSFIIIPIICFTIYKIVEEICIYKTEKLKRGGNKE